ncbi:MAG: 2Fe-2S iron-sulfur cluster-binding protein [Deltaproteobacteria bacterium]|nr:2Fe-2S iron-sulfur cluster-binding protein [Deltaproteobacteria bacterium]
MKSASKIADNAAMATVRYASEGDVTVEVPVGSTLLEASKLAGVAHGSACGGVCACSTCHVIVSEGQKLLSEAEDEEMDILDKAFDVRLHSRLGCQAKITREGLIVLEITRESREAYYNEHPDERHAMEQAARDK